MRNCNPLIVKKLNKIKSAGLPTLNLSFNFTTIIKLNHFITMKNISKLGLAAFIALSFAACKGTGSTSTTDTTKVTDSTKTTVVDTTKKDTATKMTTDTTKKDTTKKP